MRNGFKIAIVLALLAGAGLTGQGLFANCQESNGYPLVQCGARTWFASPPAGSGPVSAAWWQLGFGNSTRNASDEGNSAISGTGFQAGDGFIGNDNGTRTSLGDLDLVSAAAVGGPAGSLCFSSASSWGPPGVDGCADNARSGLGPNGGVKNDNILNPYWGPYYGLGTYTRDYLVDAPMGVLLTEGSGRNFALAFLASENRALNANDADNGRGFEFRAIANGDPNPVTVGFNNLIPWQPVPQPQLSVSFTNPSDTNSDRIVNMTWTAVRVVDDGSTRPSPDTTLGGATGVGVLDQGPLVRHVAETAPIVDGAGNCGTFAPVASSETTGTSTSVTVPGNTCVRLATQFGRKPQAVTVNAANCSNGRCGDVGYGVASAVRKIGGALVSERVNLLSADRLKNEIRVRWETTTELTMTSFDIVAKDGKGERVVGTKRCSECSNGLNAQYEALVPVSELKGAKTIVVVAKPSGTRSNEVTIQ